MQILIWINLFNLYGYDDIFKDIRIPDDIDKEILINTIADYVAEYEPIYYNMPFLNLKIKNFFLKNYDVFDRLNKAFTMDYNPLHNYDKTQSITETIDNSTEDNSENINQTSSFDNTDFVNNEKNNTKGNTKGKTTRTFADKTRGNIGVTTSTQMLDQELNLRPRLNIYTFIAKIFYNEFCIYIINT